PLLDRPPRGVSDTHAGFARPVELDLPDADAAIAAELLEHAGAAGEPRGQFLPHLRRAAVQVGVGAPSDIAGRVEDLLRPEPCDDVGMGAHEYAGGGGFAQDRVENRTVAAVL